MRRRSVMARTRTASRPLADRSKDAEFLIDQCQKLTEIYGQRCSAADSQATTVLTASVTLAALIVTASATLRGTSTGLAVAALVALVISAAIAVWEGSGAGLRPMDSSKAARADPEASTRRSLLSHETPEFWEASEHLRRAMKHQVADDAHRAALDVWSERASDLHYIARWKERAAAAAGVVLAIAVILIAVLAVKLVADHPRPSGTSGHVATAMTRPWPGRPLPLLGIVADVRDVTARHGS
jgi:hypothetical protein